MKNANTEKFVIAMNGSNIASLSAQV